MLQSNYGNKWSLDETILAYRLLMKIGAAKIDKKNPAIIELAALLERSPGAVGLKMANLAHFDSNSGMSHGSRLDAEVVEKYSTNLEMLHKDAQQVETRLRNSSNFGKKWSAEETILAYYWYQKIGFSKIDKRNDDVKRLATLLGRTPGSVGLKMANLAHFDPELQSKLGMSHASKLDQEIATRYANDEASLACAAHQIEESLRK